MEDIRIYDYEFNLLHIEHDIISCNMTLYENDIGSFELHFPTDSRLTGVMMAHQYLVAVQGDKQAIVTGRQLNSEGVLYGKSCNWLLTRFCVAEDFDTDALKADGILDGTDALTVCRFLLKSALPDGADIAVEAAAELTPAEVHLENKGVTAVFDLIQECLRQAGLGHSLFFDVSGRRWVLRVTQGAALPLLLSEGNRNAYEVDYTEDMQNYVTGGRYEQAIEDMGDWDASTNEPTLTNNVSSNYAAAYRVSTAGVRFGMTFDEGDYIVCRTEDGTWTKDTERPADFWVHIPSEKTGLYAWEGALDGSTKEEAERDLKSKGISREMTAGTVKLLFGRGYRLGDSVKIELAKGSFRQTLTKKIIGVRLWYENNDIGEEPILEDEET